MRLRLKVWIIPSILRLRIIISALLEGALKRFPREVRLNRVPLCGVLGLVIDLIFGVQQCSIVRGLGGGLL